MLTFSFTIAPSLKTELENIIETKNKLLIQQVGRDEEIQAKWEIMIGRSTHAAQLTNDQLDRQDAVKIINPFKVKATTISSEARAYINTCEWTNQEWFMNKRKVEAHDIKKLYNFFPNKIQVDDKQLQNTLDFIQVNPEHPIVQAGLTFVLISELLPANDQNLMLSVIAANVFLYRSGFDFRGLLDLEEFLANDINHLNAMLNEVKATRNLSSFLEYFTQGVSISAEKALKGLIENEFKNDLPSSFYHLTERQKEILILFAKPNVKISNKNVQKEFGISQITASRDLAKLHTLGLIFSAGKGRSVYYTKI